MKGKYLIITPIRDEANYVIFTLNSVLKQTILPSRWIFVDDNSIDETPNILKKYSEKYSFIKIKSINQETERLPGIGVMRAFEYGLKDETLDDYDFIVKLDADLEFNEFFFENIFNEFNRTKNLGIASGLIIEANGKPTSENFQHHTYGNTKIYSVGCLKSILPIEKIKYWDLIDNIKANINGYETKIIYSERVTHLKPMDSKFGKLKEAKIKGYYSAYLHYNKLFFFLKSLRIFFEKPYFLNGVYHIYGYLSNILFKKEFYHNNEVIKYLQQQQKNRLTKMFKYWLSIK